MYVNVPFVVFLYPQFNLVICTTTAAHEPNTVVQSGRATNIYCAFIYPSISIYYMYQSFYISYGFDLCITLRMCGFVTFILSLKNFDISQNKNKQLVHCSTHTHTHWIFYIKSSTTNTQNTIHTQNFGKQNWVSTCNAYFNQIQIYNQQFSIIVVVAVSVFTIEIMICYCYWCLRSIVVQLNCFGWAWKPKLFDEKEEFHFSVHKLNQLKIQWKQTFTFDFEFRSMFIVCSNWTFCVLFPLQKIADNSRYYPMKRPVK